MTMLNFSSQGFLTSVFDDFNHFLLLANVNLVEFCFPVCYLDNWRAAFFVIDIAKFRAIM